MNPDQTAPMVHRQPMNNRSSLIRVQTKATRLCKQMREQMTKVVIG